MRAQQEQANQLAQAQLEAQQLQIELTKEQLALMGREQDRLD
jgi:hypothetical protein